MTVDDLKFFVIGTGCCGTGYVHKLLNNCGIATGHEAVFNPYRAPEEPVPEGLVGESSYMGVPYLETRAVRAAIVHVVRDPVAVIRSMVGRLFPVADTVYDAWARHHVPELDALVQAPVDAAVVWYLRWNLRCELMARYRVRVEDLITREALAELLDVLGMRLDEQGERKLDEALAQTPTNYNSRPRGELAMADLHATKYFDDFKRMASRYGYDLEASK